MKQILVVGAMRSGTTVFRRLLASGGEADDIGEVFHSALGLPHSFYRWICEQGGVHPFDYHKVWPLFLADQTDKIPIIDLKNEALALAADIGRDRPWPCFPMRAISSTVVIRLKRRDKIAQARSIGVALKSGVWSVEPGHPVVPPSPVDEQEVAERARALQQRDDYVDAITGPLDTVYYEDMFEGDLFDDAFVRHAEELTGLRNLNRTPGLVRQTGVGAPPV